MQKIHYKSLNPLRFSVEYHFLTSPRTSNKKNYGGKVLLFIISMLAFYSIYDFKNFAFYFVLSSNLLYFINFIFKFYLFLIYCKLQPLSEPELQIDLNNLPTYTILLPCYKEEKETLQNLITSISNLDYNTERLDVKFLLEEDDLYTINNLKELNHNFELCLVPHFLPKTKPKACNFGLYFARGEFVVIYDAEDTPERNQLLKALNCFNNNGKNVICIQAKLNFYNANKNILSRFFSLEYLAWFNAFLPAIIKLNLFIPLGGTSNHFKTDKLIEIGGWDAYNVTEDAELGVRIAKNGYRSDILNSYTLEEAPFKLEDWIFQRKRWMKGYLQTFFAHFLDFKGNKIIGLWNIFGIIALIGFSFFSFFLIPLTMFFIQFITINNLALLILMQFNAFCILLYMLMFFYIAKKENFIKYKATSIIFMPVYFLLHSVASVLAFFAFFFAPFHWDKTKHSVK